MIAPSPLRESYEKIMARLNCPPRVMHLQFSMGINRLATCHVTYQPTDANGRPIIRIDLQTLETIAEEFVMIPRRVYDTLPESFRAEVAAMYGTSSR